jgi:hypothetical protein
VGHGKGVGKILVEALASDVILANARAERYRETQSLPIVFVGGNRPCRHGHRAELGERGRLICSGRRFIDAIPVQPQQYT